MDTNKILKVGHRKKVFKAYDKLFIYFQMYSVENSHNYNK